jgi:hypothetical protein
MVNTDKVMLIDFGNAIWMEATVNHCLICSAVSICDRFSKSVFHNGV